MATLTVRNVPTKVVKSLKSLTYTLKQSEVTVLAADAAVFTGAYDETAVDSTGKSQTFHDGWTAVYQRRHGQCRQYLCVRRIQQHDPESDAGRIGDDGGRTGRQCWQRGRDGELCTVSRPGWGGGGAESGKSN